MSHTCDLCPHPRKEYWYFSAAYNHVLKKHPGHDPNAHLIPHGADTNGMLLVPDRPRAQCKLCPRKLEFNE